MALVVAAAIVDSKDNPTALMGAARAYPPRLRGKWELPGGKVDAGDSSCRAALMRELREELGIAPQLGEEVRPPRGQAWPILDGLDMRVWLAYLPSDAARPALPKPGDSHCEVAWVAFDDMESVEWLSADIPIVQAVARQAMGSR